MLESTSLLYQETQKQAAETQGLETQPNMSPRLRTAVRIETTFGHTISRTMLIIISGYKLK